MDHSKTGAWGPPSQGKILPHAATAAATVASSLPATVASLRSPVVTSSMMTSTSSSSTTATAMMIVEKKLLAPDWTVRDAANELAQERRSLLEQPTPTEQHILYLSTHYNTAMVRLQQQTKSLVVQAAFTAAAQQVLQAVLLLQPTAPAPAAASVAAFAVSPQQQQGLQLLQLQNMRSASFERALHNKEYTKKKDPKVDSQQQQQQQQQQMMTLLQQQRGGVQQQHSKVSTNKESNGDTDQADGTTATSAITTNNNTTTNNNNNMMSTTTTPGGTATPTPTTSMPPPAAMMPSNSFKQQQQQQQLSTASKMSSLASFKSAAGGTTTDSSSSSKPRRKSSSSSLHANSNTANSNNTDGPKFTRNTPASSAAALDFRFTSSRAILCAAGNLAFEALTPSLLSNNNNKQKQQQQLPINVLDVPQNTASDKSAAALDTTTNSATTTTATTTLSSPSSSSSPSTAVVNMGAVVVEAQTLAQRTIQVAQNAVHRSSMRYQYRKRNAAYDAADKDFLVVPNPCQWKDSSFSSEAVPDAMATDDDDDDDSDSGGGKAIAANPVAVAYKPNTAAITETWTSLCLPRFWSVLKKGAGHAVYHDVDWPSRHGRVAHLLQSLARKDDNMGPHLIVTTEPNVRVFAQEFHDMSNHVSLVTSNPNKDLNVLVYQGSAQRRCKLRRYFSRGTGLPEAPFHVIVTSYASFLQDYFHFCQLPFEMVVLDDGVSWMAAAEGDKNSAIGSIWDGAIWSKNDHQVGLAGTTFKEWDFSKDVLSEATIKDAWIGLTARHRVMTSSTLRIQQRQSVELPPVSGLIDFVAPHFSDVVREEWDRSKISSDSASMEHFRQLMARSTVVHHPHSTERDIHALAVMALNGKLPAPDRLHDPQVPEMVSDDDFISNGMVAFSRRSCLQWLGPSRQSWLRYELGSASVKHILDAIKVSSSHGPVCEEITTASSTTSSGATGQVAGTMAYRLALRCGRHFGSEQGLRQHISALHAPPGTWLCRTCTSDCITSQARTHHERSCGQPTNGVNGDQGGSVGATPTVGQGGPAKAGVGKKKGKASQQSAAPGEEKDTDGSFRVPGYRGVWVNTSGKHFVKIDGERLAGTEGGTDLLFFDNIDDAARKHDSILRIQKKKNHNQKMELNFKADGSRVLYEDITPASTSGLGGSASNVVPALSVINIKDLPPDVKPLLRDPRQTSRTGGNSKRHIYAYRGVCRQARKGHDRWQSQISFMGVNHYLGTFDSEWDAAAIYAWAHLILYGEEATRQAQKEGEEAAAAYEQEKRDIASGKIKIPEPSKPEKKKKVKKEKKDSDPKEKTTSTTPAKGEKAVAPEGVQSSEKAEKTTKKRKSLAKDTSGSEKKPRASQRVETIAPVLAKGVTKASILSPPESFDGMDDSELMKMASMRLVSARELEYRASEALTSFSGVERSLRPCIPVAPVVSSSVTHPVGGAMLLGLAPSFFGWDPEDFIARCELKSEQDTMTAIQMLAVEYDDGGTNTNFQTMVQSSVCVIGNATTSTQRLYKSLGLGSVPLGGSVGKLDCHIGGVPGSCSEKAACITHSPTTISEFQFACLSTADMVTLNGKRITAEMGCFPLYNEDVCTVGARVFVFLLPMDR